MHVHGAPCSVFTHTVVFGICKWNAFQKREQGAENVWQLTQSGQFPTHQFGISIGILCFKSIDFIKSQIWQH